MPELLNYILTQEDAFRKNRLPSLYSDFSLQKRTNPDGYAVNVSTWEQALTRAAKQGYISSTPTVPTPTSKNTKPPSRMKSNHLILKTDESLIRDLEIPELGAPVALSAVFGEAIQKQSMVPLQLYKTGTVSLRKSQWSLIDPGVLSPWRVMSWGMQQLRGFVVGSDSLASPRLQVQELVLVENLKETGDRVVKQALGSSSKMELVISKEGFMDSFATVLNGETELSEADFNVLLLYLSRDCGAIAYDGRTIKFRASEDAPAEITNQDTTIASIRSLMSTISNQVETLEAKIAELTSVAKTALSNKNRISALSAVRSKKIAEHNLQQRLNTLTQLEEVYSKIEHATDQIEYVKMMEASTGVLRGLHAQIGGTDRVEDVVDGLREEMSKVDEVGNVMNEAGPVIDEGEIDDELEGLEAKERVAAEEKEAEETRKKLAGLDALKQDSKNARAAREGQNVEAALAENIERLSQMSVEEDSARQAKERPLSAK